MSHKRSVINNSWRFPNRQPFVGWQLWIRGSRTGAKKNNQSLYIRQQRNDEIVINYKERTKQTEHIAKVDQITTKRQSASNQLETKHLTTKNRWIIKLLEMQWCGALTLTVTA